MKLIITILVAINLSTGVISAAQLPLDELRSMLGQKADPVAIDVGAKLVDGIFKACGGHEAAEFAELLVDKSSVVSKCAVNQFNKGGGVLLSATTAAGQASDQKDYLESLSGNNNQIIDSQVAKAKSECQKLVDTLDPMSEDLKRENNHMAWVLLTTCETFVQNKIDALTIKKLGIYARNEAHILSSNDWHEIKDNGSGGISLSDALDSYFAGSGIAEVREQGEQQS